MSSPVNRRGNWGSEKWNHMLKVMLLQRVTVRIPTPVYLSLKSRLWTTIPSFFPFLPCFPCQLKISSWNKESSFLYHNFFRFPTDSLTHATISKHVVNIPGVKGDKDLCKTVPVVPIIIQLWDPRRQTWLQRHILPDLFIVPLPTATPVEMVSVTWLTMN